MKAKATSYNKKMPPERSVLDLSAEEARAFFLKQESYCSLDLPPYFDFSPPLKNVAKFLARKQYANLKLTPRTCEGVNYTIYSNKDGRYAWRPFQLIHPILYVHLINVLTESKTWKVIQDRFKEFAKDPNICCLSIPQKSLTKRKDKGAQILHWWQGIEQATIELALDFNYLFHADITDCYSSIYTHSIAWALHGKKDAKAQKKEKNLIGNVIDGCIQDMQQGQTNGIPQGSVLMDLIAEMVLGYADLELSKRLADASIKEFKILRYRDDYRILVNDTLTGDKILKQLTEVLIELGLKLNASKTSGPHPLIASALKIDKRQWMLAKQKDQNLQKHLLIIHSHATQFPNAGSLLVALDEFYKRLVRLRSVKNSLQLISIVIDIGYNSPRCFPACAAIVSKLLSMLRTKAEKARSVERIRRRLDQLPNNGHLEVWLQRISYPFNPNLTYKEQLCRLVEGSTEELWNNSWITDTTLKAKVAPKAVLNRSRLKAIRPIVPRSEFVVFVPY